MNADQCFLSFLPNRCLVMSSSCTPWLLLYIHYQCFVTRMSNRQKDKIETKCLIGLQILNCLWIKILTKILHINMSMMDFMYNTLSVSVFINHWLYLWHEIRTCLLIRSFPWEESTGHTDYIRDWFKETWVEVVYTTRTHTFSILTCCMRNVWTLCEFCWPSFVFLSFF